ncbi:hypothetical protein [Micromonospora sp. RP3T]|uniref:hypothetical protein n=1 Tax=Micromonospora sp. RP3T TaxID=2135446 RepID=UPI003D7233AC
MPPHPHRPPQLAGQVFRGSDAVRRGLLSRHHLRGASWVRLRQDVYADARLDRDHALACRAVLLRMPAGTLIAGPSAAHLHGVAHAAGFTDDVHVLLPASVRADSHPGVRVHQAPLVSPRDGLLVPAHAVRGGDSLASGGTTTAATSTSIAPATSHRATAPAACAWETAVWADPVRAVGIIDGLLRVGAVSRSGLATEAARNAGRPGGRRASWVFGLADGCARSPAESHLRVRLVFAGLPRPVAQHPVRVSAGLVRHADLAWPEFRVAVEYAVHRPAEPDVTHVDRCRLHQLVEAGWLVLHVTGRRLRTEFPALVREIRGALVARGWRP